MKLNISFNPLKARNIIPSLMTLRAMFNNYYMVAESGIYMYAIATVVFYSVFSIIANVIANLAPTKSECEKVEEKSIEVEE